MTPVISFVFFPKFQKRNRMILLVLKNKQSCWPPTIQWACLWIVIQGGHVPPYSNWVAGCWFWCMQDRVVSPSYSSISCPSTNKLLQVVSLIMITLRYHTPTSPLNILHCHTPFFFLRFTQYNADAHNTYAHSFLWIHIRKPYPYEHLRRTEHRQIWRFSKSPLAPHRRREHRLPLNA
jgi:hypothetical protein